MIQPSLLDWQPPAVIFGDRDGISFDRKRDGKRLNKQARDVYAVMECGDWFTLRQIADMTGHPEASISARIRDFRKGELGGFKVERQNRGKGTWYYRLVLP